MKITELKIEVVTTETRYHTFEDPEAVDANEDGEVTISYLVNLRKPKIRPWVSIKIEDDDPEFIVGGVYLFANCNLQFVAVDKKTLKQTEYKSFNPEEFNINIEGPVILVAHAMKEG